MHQSTEHIPHHHGKGIALYPADPRRNLSTTEKFGIFIFVKCDNKKVISRFTCRPKQISVQESNHRMPVIVRYFYANKNVHQDKQEGKRIMRNYHKHFNPGTINECSSIKNENKSANKTTVSVADKSVNLSLSLSFSPFL